MYSRKPAPSMLAVPHVDEDAVRADIRATLDVTRGCVVELIMKDNHTLGRNPENIVRLGADCPGGDRQEVVRLTRGR